HQHLQEIAETPEFGQVFTHVNCSLVPESPRRRFRRGLRLRGGPVRAGRAARSGVSALCVFRRFGMPGAVPDGCTSGCWTDLPVDIAPPVRQSADPWLPAPFRCPFSFKVVRLALDLRRRTAMKRFSGQRGILRPMANTVEYTKCRQVLSI